MITFIDTIKTYWPLVLAVLTALHALLGAINALIPPGKVPAWFRFIIDRLGALPQPGMKGALGKYNPPFMGSRPVIKMRLVKAKKRKK